MKHFKALLVLSLILSSNIYPQTLEALEKQIVFKNHIKTKARINYKYISGNLSKTGLKSGTITYNHSGEILIVNSFNKNGIVTGTEKYKYDVNGNRILFERTGNSKYKKVSKYNSKNQVLLESGFNGAEQFRNEYEYTPAGKLSKVTNTLAGRTQQTMMYKYTGDMAQISIYARGSSLGSKMKMKYDNKGNLLEETAYSIDGREIEKKNYSYNSSSQLLEEKKTTNGNLYYHLSYSYNKRGNLVSVYEETISKKKYSKKIYIYDANGNLNKYKWRRNPKEDFNEKTYSYNSKGICLTEQTYYPKTKFKLLTKFEYDFY